MLLLACLSTALMLADDFFQQLFTQANQSELELEYVSVLWVLNLMLWCSGMRWFVNLVLVLFATMQLIQLGHISLTGTPVTPYDLGKAVSESEEIRIALLHSLKHHWHVLLVWALPYGLLFVLFNRYLKPVPVRYGWVPLIIVLLILGSKPERALRRDMISFMPGPTRSSLYNSINAFSFYFARMAWRQPVAVDVDFRPYEITRNNNTPNGPDNIVLLVIDSLRHDRLQVAGYGRNNTPYLQRLAGAGELQVRQGLASSVATGASLPLLLNVVNEPGHIAMLQSGVANLFRRAKEAGYKTFWLSTQESRMLNGVGSQYIDVRQTREDDPIDVERYGDLAVNEWLGEQQWSDKNFVFILLRSVHSPYSENYDSADTDFEIWPVNDTHLTTHVKLNNAYDNSIYFVDQLVEQQIALLKETFRGNTIWLATSDHGQLLGESQQWGHNRLDPHVASVPVLLHQWPTHAQHKPYQLPEESIVSHYELGNWLLDLMGFALDNPNHTRNVHFFQSDELYGNNMYQPVIENGQELTFCDVEQVDNYVRLPTCAISDSLLTKDRSPDISADHQTYN